MKKYNGVVFTGNGYKMRPVGEVHADTLPQLKRLASIIVNGFYNVSDRLEVTYTGEYVTTEYTVVFHRYNKKAPNNTIKRGQWR